jgi:uncharacterized membrane protein
MHTTNEYDGQPTATPTVVDWVKRVEHAGDLDRLVRLIRPVADALVSDHARRDVLRGMWIGHAMHPALTDVTIGFLTSANVLDLVGGKQSQPAARRLVALGILSAGPTAITGLSEWAGTGRREQRVGVVHAGSNVVALSLYAASWMARRNDRQVRGVMLGVAGSAVAGIGGYLGSHLAAVRKVSSRHPGFEDPVTL